jgi:hypothetical protein
LLANSDLLAGAGIRVPATSVVIASSSRWASAARATVRRVATPITTEDLASDELEALRAAGAWYAKYHAVRIAELADDPSAYAEHKREKFLTLVTALRKLGFEMALPDALRADERQAA